ncbi:hypothetical protein SDC9_67677 [bioreactor metagenome]|uniref:Uncharacterized protein n=1 Tax=bioreactor metagenome TaxID=1076179 RepID=A0A644Y3W3_9ZZZZ
MHQAEVVVHRRQPQGRGHLIRAHQGRVGFGRGRRAVSLKAHVRAEGADIILKIQKLCIDVAIALLLGVAHVVKLVQNHVKGFLNGIDAGNFLPALVPGLLHPEVGIHQCQRLRGQVLKLQIPHGMVGGDEADGFHPPLGKPLVGVVVVEVGHPLPGLAAEFSDVVARSGGREQREVHGPARRVVGPHNAHGHMVDPGDVLQRAEGRHIPAKAHGLIYILAPKAHQKLAVFLRRAAMGKLFLRAEGKVKLGVEGERLPLRVQKDLQNVEIAQGPVALLGGVLHVR